MTREAAQRLLRAQNGDAALLYLALLEQGNGEGLSWSEERLYEAFDALTALKLVDPKVPPKQALPEKPEPQQAPEYSPKDVTLAMSEGSFPLLVEEMQRRLGRLLSPADLQTLLLLTDYLALPFEVILLLVSWCMETTAEKHGAGRKPTLSQIKTEAFRWHRRGIDTLTAAEEYLLSLRRGKEAVHRLLPLVGITGRRAVEPERRYLEAWNEMGFADDAIVLAYEKTVLKKQTLNWPYMNSILRRWHQSGMHTKAEVLEKERGRYRKPTAQTTPPPQQMQKDLERLDRLLGPDQGKGG